MGEPVAATPNCAASPTVRVWDCGSEVISGAAAATTVSWATAEVVLRPCGSVTVTE